MIWHDYQLDHTIFKTTEDIRLWDSEKGIVEIHKDTLAIPMKLDDKQNGYIFHGHGKLILDTIVETDEGAIGESVEKPLNKPFLMLGDIEEAKQHLSEAGEEDLTRVGYENKQGFIDAAEHLFNRFSKNGRTHSDPRFSEDRSVIFAFQNQNDKLGILVARGPKLVYTAKDIVFVSNRNRVVLNRPEEVVCSGNGKSVIINKGRSVIIKK